MFAPEYHKHFHFHRQIYKLYGTDKQMMGNNIMNLRIVCKLQYRWDNLN